MQHWVVMNEVELLTSMSLLGASELADAVRVPEGFEPAEHMLDEMLHKGYLELTDGDGLTWNDFVLAVLWSAFHADSELRVGGGADLPPCCLFFKADTIVLLAREGEATYRFFHLLAIPQAVDCLSQVHSDVEGRMGWKRSNRRASLGPP